MRERRFANLCIWALATPALEDGVEYHQTTLVWEQAGPYPAPLTFSASPLPYFDTWGGQRRLARLRTIWPDWSWQSKVTIDNPFHYRQCIEYTTYVIEASASTPISDLQFSIAPPFQRHRLGAPPLTQVYAEHTWKRGTGWRYERAPDVYETTMKTSAWIVEYSGNGLIPIEMGFSQCAYDTRGVAKANCDCSGGYLGAGLAGFDEVYTRFEIVFELEYHWVDACGGDLTTWSDPGQFPQQFYGVPDGFVDAHDFFYYLDQFSIGNLAVADLTTGAILGQPGYGTPNGVLNNDDFFYFLTLFATGC